MLTLPGCGCLQPCKVRARPPSHTLPPLRCWLPAALPGCSRLQPCCAIRHHLSPDHPPPLSAGHLGIPPSSGRADALAEKGGPGIGWPFMCMMSGHARAGSSWRDLLHYCVVIGMNESGFWEPGCLLLVLHSNASVSRQRHPGGPWRTSRILGMGVRFMRIIHTLSHPFAGHCSGQGLPGCRGPC